MEAAIQNAKNEIISCYRRLCETRKKNQNCYCFDIFAKRNLTDWHLPQYTWQWNLTIQEYNEIKDVLANYASVLKEVIKQNKIWHK